MDLQEAALIGLSIFGVILIVAMVWILSKMREKRRDHSRFMTIETAFPPPRQRVARPRSLFLS
jgi:hypothetical protein